MLSSKPNIDHQTLPLILFLFQFSTKGGLDLRGQQAIYGKVLTDDDNQYLLTTTISPLGWAKIERVISGLKDEN